LARTIDKKQRLGVVGTCSNPIFRIQCITC